VWTQVPQRSPMGRQATAGAQGSSGQGGHPAGGPGALPDLHSEGPAGILYTHTASVVQEQQDAMTQLQLQDALLSVVPTEQRTV
jgi:hypothetical protein